jgi:hypothetical protein
MPGSIPRITTMRQDQCIVDIQGDLELCHDLNTVKQGCACGGVLECGDNNKHT